MSRSTRGGGGDQHQGAGTPHAIAARTLAETSALPGPGTTQITTSAERALQRPAPAFTSAPLAKHSPGLDMGRSATAFRMDKGGQSPGSGSLLLRVEEAAELLAIGRSKLYLLIQAGKVPGIVRIGKSIRIHRESLEEWVRQQANASPVDDSG